MPLDFFIPFNVVTSISMLIRLHMLMDISWIL